MAEFLLAGVLLAAQGAAAEGSAPDLVATVNGEAITREELLDELLLRYGRSVLEDMIRRSAIEQELARSGVKVSEKEITEELAAERRQFGARLKVQPPGRGDPGTFEELVSARYSMSMEGYRDIVRRWLMVRKMILKQEEPSEDGLLLYFYKNRERYDTPAELTVRHIFISKKDPAAGGDRPDEVLRGRIADVRKELLKGKDFGSLARKYSDDPATRGGGGLLGTVNAKAAKEHLEPAFAEALLRLRPGQTGGPVETPKGYHFLQVTARKEGKRAEFEDLRARARADYLEERALQMRELWVRRLMERTRVTRDLKIPERRRPEDAAYFGPGPAGLRPSEIEGK